MRYSKAPWIIFVLALPLAAYFVLHSSPALPPLVASHFDAAGAPNAFMPRQTYVHFMLAMTVGFPAGLVGILTLAFSYAGNLKVPNRDYWLSPERIAGTRAFLVARAAWFGVMLCLMMGVVHYLELKANAQVPPHLSGSLAVTALLGFFLATAGWIFALMTAFRRP
jgi:uncharacterized membrane protein